LFTVLEMIKICSYCRHKFNSSGLATCEKCLARAKRRLKSLKRQGICTFCGQRKAIENRIYCRKCTAATAKRSKKQRSEAVRKGICYICGSVVSKTNYYLCEKHRLSTNKYQRKLSLRKKIEVLTYYGKRGTLQCCWRGCNIQDVDMLTLDHVFNDGAKHRRRLGRTGIPYSVIAKSFPDGFQTLCAGHQLKKQILVLRKR
jgi:hypothetical protein